MALRYWTQFKGKSNAFRIGLEFDVYALDLHFLLCTPATALFPNTRRISPSFNRIAGQITGMNGCKKPATTAAATTVAAATAAAARALFDCRVPLLSP